MESSNSTFFSAPASASTITAQLSSYVDALPRIVLLPPLVLVICVASTYFFTNFLWLRDTRLKNGTDGRGSVGKSPTVPYAVPFLAHGVELVRGSSTISKLLLKYSNLPFPVHFKVFGLNLYFLSDPGAIQQVWRESKWFSFLEMKSIILEYSFGAPCATMDAYRLDDSGVGSVPRPGSRGVGAPQTRFLHMEAVMLRKLLGAQAMVSLTDGYVRGVAQRTTIDGIDGAGITDEWTQMPCLWRFVRDLAFAASLDSFCGPDLLQTMPGFLDDFWVLDENITKLSRKLPRWLVPGVYRARDTCRDGIRHWREDVLERLKKGEESGEEIDIPWGTNLVKERDNSYSTIPMMDGEARAAFDLALIWASHSNPVAGTFWILYKVLTSPELLTRTQAALSTSCPDTSLASTDTAAFMAPLTRNAFLQALFAETLRLYVSMTNLRKLEHRDFDIGGARVPETGRILYGTQVQHMNPVLWQEGPMAGFPPVDEFCPDRFLMNKRQQQRSGKQLNDPTTSEGEEKKKTTATRVDDDDNSKHDAFSLDGLTGVWLPFGGGSNMCPGRDYAKNQMLATLAILLDRFEFDVLPAGQGVAADDNRYGVGTLIPDRTRQIPFRIRRRRTGQTPLSPPSSSSSS